MLKISWKKDIKCLHLKENGRCYHPDANTLLGFQEKCAEVKYDHLECVRKESIFDVIKKIPGETKPSAPIPPRGRIIKEGFHFDLRRRNKE